MYGRIVSRLTERVFDKAVWEASSGEGAEPKDALRAVLLIILFVLTFGAGMNGLEVTCSRSSRASAEVSSWEPVFWTSSQTPLNRSKKPKWPQSFQCHWHSLPLDFYSSYQLIKL
ncbi:hypothetical protein B9Z55_003817 [Caenorhabditis nigoni]|uniref:Uncharacterized protein n=1 Tax=Caenorhabditis nigoni TaxID=1611254 RepID=A0A2G5VS86_9PELO|nr:hypothetical protein B9Z55_003817 [Caenorhabditis nigoni]